MYWLFSNRCSLLILNKFILGFTPMKFYVRASISKIVLGTFCTVFAASGLIGSGLSAQDISSNKDMALLEQVAPQSETVNLNSDLIIRDAEEVGLETGLPMPRYVSLKSNKINLRTGPGFRYPVDWVFQRRMLPVIVVEEFENWRQVRTHDGIIGWLHKNMISGVRTFRLVKDVMPLKAKPGLNSADMAKLSVGVVGRINSCDLSWCEVEIESSDHGKIDGWLSKTNMFGVGPEEVIR